MATRRAGKAPPGRGFDPKAQPRQPDTPRPAPTHGTPVSPQELERLKRRARKLPPVPGAPSQDEDKDT